MLTIRVAATSTSAHDVQLELETAKCDSVWPWQCIPPHLYVFGTVVSDTTSTVYDLAVPSMVYVPATVNVRSNAEKEHSGAPPPVVAARFLWGAHQQPTTRQQILSQRGVCSMCRHWNTRWHDGTTTTKTANIPVASEVSQVVGATIVAVQVVCEVVATPRLDANDEPSTAYTRNTCTIAAHPGTMQRHSKHIDASRYVRLRVVQYTE
jgi:hypothetical protein